MRQAKILEEVRRTGGARVTHLTALLGVSDMTVRRDLETLDRKGLLSKVHGGATAMDTASAIEPGFEVTSQREVSEKEAIAAQGRQLIRPGMAIAITAGSTTWTLARHLGDIANLTVVTNSLKVAEVLNARQRPDLTVVLTGGLRTPSDGLVGPGCGAGHPVAARGHGDHGRARHRRAGRPDHAEPAGGRDQPRVGRIGPPAGGRRRPHQVGGGRVSRRSRRSARSPPC